MVLYDVARLIATPRAEMAEMAEMGEDERMPDVPANDLIWIQEAATEYDRSRPWLDKQVELGKLSLVRIEGDKRVYLRRSQLDALLRPYEDERGQGASGSQVG